MLQKNKLGSKTKNRVKRKSKKTKLKFDFYLKIALKKKDGEEYWIFYFTKDEVTKEYKGLLKRKKEKTVWSIWLFDNPISLKGLIKLIKNIIKKIRKGKK